MAVVVPRLAIGLSQDPVTFDHSRILPLCFADPPSLRGSALVSVRFQDHADPIFTGRAVLSSSSPRAFRRTGYGTRLRWAIDLTFETMAGQAGQFPSSMPDIDGPMTVPLTQVPTDDSLLVLASAFGRSSSRGFLPPSTPSSPPHIFLTASYQCDKEQWFPVDVHENTSSVEQPFSLKTWTRTMSFELCSRDTFMDVGIVYEPAYDVHSGTGAVTSLTDPAPGRQNATLVLSAALRGDVVVGDTMLVQFQDTGVHVFYRFLITSINGPRTTVQGTSPLPWPYGIPSSNPVHNPASYWTMKPDAFYKLPLYLVYDFSGNLFPAAQFSPNKDYTILIG